MQQPKPTHKEDVLNTLKETLTKALETIERLKEENPIMLRNDTNTVDFENKIKVQHSLSWGVLVTEENKEQCKKFLDGKFIDCMLTVGCFVGISNKKTPLNLPYHGPFTKGYSSEFRSEYYDRIITTEEFYDKIGYKKEEKREVLFTTEDGVDIHEKDSYFSVCDDFKIYRTNWAKPIKEKIRAFSSVAAAEEYILLNKPCLSLNDLLSVWNDGRPVDRSNSIMFGYFKSLAQDKLDNNK